MIEYGFITQGTDLVKFNSFLVIIILHDPELPDLPTLFTAETDFFIHLHQPLFISRNGLNRSSLLAGCVGAMVSVIRIEIGGSSYIREGLKKGAWLEVNTGGSWRMIGAMAGCRLNLFSKNLRICCRCHPVGCSKRR